MGLIQLAEQLEAAAAELRAIAGRDTTTPQLPLDQAADDGHPWTENPGTGEPPASLSGRVVDIEFDDGTTSTGPADIWDWSTAADISPHVVRARLSAEQPNL